MRRVLGIVGISALLCVAASGATEDVEHPSPGLYYFYGRGVLRVPSGWRLKETLKDHDLKFEKHVSDSPDDEMCFVMPGVYVDDDGSRAKGDQMAAYFIEDDIDDFNQKTAKDAHRQSRRWSVPYRGMTAARFVGWSRIPHMFIRGGSSIDGYFSNSVIVIAKAGVTMTVHCNGFFPDARPAFADDLINAIDIDSSRSSAINPDEE